MTRNYGDNSSHVIGIRNRIYKQSCLEKDGNLCSHIIAACKKKIDPRDVMPLKFTLNRDNELLLASLPDGMSEEIEKFLEIS